MVRLREKYQNDVLHGNSVNMAPLNEWLPQLSSKFQNVSMYKYMSSDLYVQMHVSKTLNN